MTEKPQPLGCGGSLRLLGIMREHGGSVTIESWPGRGTTLRLALPVCIEPAETAPPTRLVPVDCESAG